MKQFFKFMFASMLGFFLCIVLMVFLLGALAASLVSSASSGTEQHTGPNTVLHMKFTAPLEDRSSDNPFRSFDFSKMSGNTQPGLNDIIQNLEKAAEDPNIKGVYLDLSGFSGGLASAREMRNALMDFKKSGKFILAYGEAYSQGAYYVASAATQIWLHPEGMVELKGFASEMPFFKGLLAKLEIEPQVIRHGKYKSAVEPFLLDKMSAESRTQVAEFVNSFWNQFTSEIAAARKLEQARVITIADSLLARRASDALSLKLVDKVGYFDEFLEELKEMNGNAKDETPEFISMKKYTDVPKPKSDKPFTRDRIAVIYAAGDIVGGEGSDDEIGGASLAKTIREARLDDHVKAVVLRVNSPGGDALASDVVWREVHLCRKSKPFVVSMGDVAASGGYYISCAADTIVAQPNTITGSIGVFGLMFNFQKMFNNKLGVTFDQYKTSQFADMGSSTRPMTENERKIMESWVDQVYVTFTKRVADGRHLSVEMVDSLGQGRVWSGEDAFKAGLVDVLGGLDTAVEIAAKMAKLDNYRLRELPEQKDPFKKILEEVSGEAETRWAKAAMGEQYDNFVTIQNLTKRDGVQARCFYNIRLN